MTPLSEWQEAHDSGLLTRRAFVARAGAGIGSLVLGSGLVACASEGTAPPVAKVGEVLGTVLDLQGVAQGNFGQVILMYADGRHVGPRLVPDAGGRFRFGQLAPGTYQVRFHASGQAIVPEPYQHPFKFTIEAGKTTELTVRIQRGNFTQNLVEIYCGDDFYQLQPDGRENDETIVRLGTVVCWYNVGLKIHTVTGGPWVDSGDMQKTQSYIWVANQLGMFPYRCKYNQPQMQSILRVVAAG
jgi:hypothetical protein